MVYSCLVDVHIREVHMQYSLYMPFFQERLLDYLLSLFRLDGFHHVGRGWFDIA